MKKPQRSIHFFTDNDVPDSVGNFLRDSGHQVTRLRDVMVTDSPDPVVAAACRESGLVLITHNVRDFKRIVRDYEVTRREVDRLCRIELACEQVVAKTRIESALSIIESEWDLLGEEKIGLRISIGDNSIRIHR